MTDSASSSSPSTRHETDSGDTSLSESVPAAAAAAAPEDGGSVGPQPSSSLLDDVFGTQDSGSPAQRDEPESNPARLDHSTRLDHGPPPPRPLAGEPSDVPRLRERHFKAGYREGVASARAAAAQPGFDEGYPLGAALGLRVGELLGRAEGLRAAFSTAEKKGALVSSTPSADPPGLNARNDGGSATGTERSAAGPPLLIREELAAFAAEMARSLAAPRVFGSEFLDDHAVWKWDIVVPRRHRDDGDERSLDSEPTIDEVAESHPLLVEWTQKLKVLLEKIKAQQADGPGAADSSKNITFSAGGRI